MTNEQKVENETPYYFEFLSPEDQKQYKEMKERISSSEKNFKKNKRIECFQDALDCIQQFCVRNDGEDWKRYLVCGICWMDQDIAINTRQLRILIDKCKSSINGALSKMGYGTLPIKSQISANLVNYIPYLKGNFVEQRQWTVRRKVQYSPISFRPNYFATPFLFMQPNFFTPEDSLPSSPPADSPQRDEAKATFGLENEKPQPELNFDDVNYDFLYDPCTCCPATWANDEDEEQVSEHFGFG